jgi:CBS domain containing-hemolysin-like protein
MIGEPAIAEGMVGIVGEEMAHSPWMAVVAILLLTYPHVVLGEMIPKALALTKPTSSALKLRLLMSVSLFVYKPLVWFLDSVGNKLLKLMGIAQVDETRRLFSPDELEMVVNQSRAGGLVGSTEELMVQNIFDLSERVAADIMTPRVKVDGISDDHSVKEAFIAFRDHRFSRMPVYKESLDNIVGVLYCKDLARHYAAEGETGKLTTLVRKPRFIPHSTPVEDVLAVFRAERIQMVVVLDEFGGTAGLVTFEDVVEEVVGEIQDEFDLEQNPIDEVEDGLLRVQGELLIEELAQYLKTSLAHPNVKTVGGLMLEATHDAPKVGDSTVWNNLEFRTLAVTERHVDTVEVRVLPEIEAEDESESE